MATRLPLKTRIDGLKKRFDALRRGKDALLTVIDEAEMPESVYNSNAIENSTLTLKQTERILLELEVSGRVTLREIFEAKNLSRVIGYNREKVRESNVNVDITQFLHTMLLSNINESIAGKFRTLGQYVRVGTYIAPPPEHVMKLMGELFSEYENDYTGYFLDKIAKFHLGFETIHPFVDGNGRIGREIMNFQLFRVGFPRIIIRDKEKEVYYRSFVEYRDYKRTKSMERLVALALIESLHKRIAYLAGETIVPLSDLVRDQQASPSGVFNAAKRQTIPAFREKGIWKIPSSTKLVPDFFLKIASPAATR